MHLMNPRSVVPQSNMPDYPWLAKNAIDGADIQARMRVLRKLGDPYSDADIAAAPAAVKGKTEMDALVAYLQGLGIDNEPHPVAAEAGKAGAP
jgi:cytochrome c oxidase cbb3-type subunit 2